MDQFTAGSLQGTQLVVEDIERVRTTLLDRGVDVSPVQTFPWGRFCYFSDVDGNGWAVEEPPRD